MDEQYYNQFTRDSLIGQIVEKDQELEDAFEQISKAYGLIHKFRIALAVMCHRASFTPIEVVKTWSPGVFFGIGDNGYITFYVDKKGTKSKLGGTIGVEDIKHAMRLPTKEQSKFLKSVVETCQHPFISDEEMFQMPWFETFKENFPQGVSDPFADEEEGENDCDCCPIEDCAGRTAPYVGGGDDEE